MDGDAFNSSEPHSKRLKSTGSNSEGNDSTALTSNSEECSTRRKKILPFYRRKRPTLPPNHVLLYTILNPRYPITTDVIHNISSPIGKVNRIVIFRKQAVQALVEFENVDVATKAKETLNGADIYSGCCTLKVEYAKPTKLNVFKNDLESWDFTIGVKKSKVYLVKRGCPTAYAINRTAPHKSSKLCRFFTLVFRQALCASGRSPLLPEPTEMRTFPEITTKSDFQVDVNKNIHTTTFLASPPFTYFYPEMGFDLAQYMRNGVTSSAELVPPFPPPPLQPPPPIPLPPPPPPADECLTIVPMSPPDCITLIPLPPSDSSSTSPSCVFSVDRTVNRVVISTSSTSYQPTPIAHSPVLMVYALDLLKTNCDKLFNLFCLYGNVIRIKFLKSKEGCAMVQMGDQFSVDRCITNLNPTDMLDGRSLSLGYSKQMFVSERRGSFTLPDGTEGFRDYSSHRHNRYYDPVSSMKNRIQPPSRFLHFYNTPPNITEAELINVFNETLDNIEVLRLKLFPRKGNEDTISKSSAGLVEFCSIPEALEALMTCNHHPIKCEGSKFPYIMKLCFSSAKNINHLPKSAGKATRPLAPRVY